MVGFADPACAGVEASSRWIPDVTFVSFPHLGHSRQLSEPGGAGAVHSTVLDWLRTREDVMKVLILGGTIFLGCHLTEAAIAAGHDVTLFNRGRHNADLYPDIEKLRGDRDGGLDALKGRTWDAAVDTCGYVPRLVWDSASRLADAVDHYTFISTLSGFGAQIARRDLMPVEPPVML
jgi:hypothetical protein